MISTGMRFRGRFHVVFSFASILLWLFAGIMGCDQKEVPIKVGFVGPLSGRLSVLGVAGRNGVTLAVEEANLAGGVNGRPVALIVRSDDHNVERALKADRELIHEGVTAIIGHMTSTMSVATLPLCNRAKIPMISPTTSSPRLGGIDDYFFRVLPSNTAETGQLAGYACKGMGLEKMIAINDLSNSAYVEAFYQTFKSEFERIGGHMLPPVTFTSGKRVVFGHLVKKILLSGADGLLILTGPLDAAMICQQVRKSGSEMKIIAGGWAMTRDFLHNGGRAANGVVFNQLFCENHNDQQYIDFKRRFRDRFGHDPSFAAVHGYEAARLLLKALKAKRPSVELKEAILNQKRFFGVQGDFSLDRFGDPQRGRFLVVSDAGRFRCLE